MNNANEPKNETKIIEHRAKKGIIPRQEIAPVKVKSLCIVEWPAFVSPDLDMMLQFAGNLKNERLTVL